MDHEAYRDAAKRRFRLSKELDKIDNFMKLYQELYPDVVKREEPNIKLESSDNLVSASQKKKEQAKNANRLYQEIEHLRVSPNPKPAEVIRVVTEILQENGGPMMRSQLLKALSKRNVILKGKDPAKLLGTNLWRSDVIESIEGAGYWIKGKELPLDFGDDRSSADED